MVCVLQMASGVLLQKQMLQLWKLTKAKYHFDPLQINLRHFQEKFFFKTNVNYLIPVVLRF